MSSLKIYLRPFLKLGLLLGLIIGFRSFLMINIIEPIATMLWIFWRIFYSVNQNIYWAFLIIFCIILVIRLVPAGNGSSPKSAYSHKHGSQSRVEYWQSLFTDAMMEKHGVEYLRSNLKELLLRIIDKEGQSNLTSSEKIALLREVPLPISVQDFLLPPKQKHKIFSGGLQLHPLFSTPRWFRKWVSKFTQPDNTLIEEVLKWMESTMEISHDI